MDKIEDMKAKSKFLRDRIKQLQDEYKRVETYIRVTEWREKNKKKADL